MREIKFRVWDEREKEMLYMIVQKNLWNFFDMLRGRGRELKRLLFMQYTGLKDKNDKEIYEGDIIKEVFPVLDTDPKKYRTRILKVRFSDFGFTPFHWLHEWQLKERTYEVISNIYENPELLEVKQ